MGLWSNPYEVAALMKLNRCKPNHTVRPVEPQGIKYLTQGVYPNAPSLEKDGGAP